VGGYRLGLGPGGSKRGAKYGILADYLQSKRGENIKYCIIFQLFSLNFRINVPSANLRYKLQKVHYFIFVYVADK